MEANSRAFTPAQRFWRLLKPDQKEIGNIYVFAVFNGLINLSLPLGIQAIINLIQGGQMSTSFVILVFFVIAGVAATGVLQIFQLRITENLQQKIFTRAAFEFTYRLPRIKMEALYRHYAPELMNRFFDTVSIQKGLSKILIDFSTALLQAVFGLILLSFYHPFFIAFSIALIALAYAIFYFSVNTGIKTSLTESKYKYEVAHWLEELARTNTTFKMAGNTELPLNHTDSKTGKYLSARESHFKVLLKQYSFMVIFKVLVATGLLVIGSMLVMEQQMNIGQFVAAEIIILLVMAAVEKLVLAMETIYDVLTSLEKVGQVTDLELENNDGFKINKDENNTGLEVELNGLSFTYPDNPNPALNNISLTLKPGELLAMTGSNESGKATLLQIIGGLYDINQGSISYNGLPKGNLNMENLRSTIGHLLDDDDIFEGTLLENISMGRPGVEFENVQWATRHLGLYDFVQALPLGYDTPLSPGGKKLPKSVVQKLLLARSVAGKPKLLLLKEPLQHLSFTERESTINFITDKQNGWTLIAATSEAELASKCDRVAVLHQGSIAKLGTYSEMKKMFTTKNISNA